MTREDAAKLLDLVKVFDAPKLSKAIEMAKAALREQELATNLHDVASNQQATKPLQRNGCEDFDESVANKNQVTSDKTSKWIPVTERLPTAEFLGKEIIACKLNRFGGQHVYVTRFWGPNSALWNDITHWMPLPQPPEVI